MTETQIRYFMKAFETGNITSASEELMVTRAAVSKVIISLENDLSHQLFVRNKTGISPTEAGEALYVRLNAQKSSYDSIEKYIKELGSESELPIRVGVTPTNIDAVYDILMEYQSMLKGRRINISEAKWNDLKELILNEKVDIAFLPIRDVSRSLPGYNAVRVYTTNVCLAVSPDHPYAQKKSVGVLDLVRTPLGYVSGVIPAERMIMTTCKSVLDIEPDVTIRSSSRELIHRLARNGSVAGVVSDSMRNEWPDLIFLPIDFAPPVDHFLIWKKDDTEQRIKDIVMFILDNLPLS